jgi:predicted HTH transcriptional regulator
MDLLEILKGPEGKTLEFKRDLYSPDGALKASVAFANTAGGTLVIGVEDRSRDVRGVTDALDLEERLDNLVSDHIRPRIVPEIEVLPWRRTQVLAVQVHPSPSRLQHLIREGPGGGVYVRVGSANRRADSELIEELRRLARAGASPSSRCRASTRKPWTSKRLPSRSPRFASSRAATWGCCGWSRTTRGARSRPWAA